MRSAIDAGITFLDNSWDYNAGASEIRMGKALRDGYRERAFLMTKIDGRSKREATRQLEDPHIHLHTLDLAREHRFTFDTVQMPLNVMDAHYRSFEKLVVPELVRLNIGVLGMKCMANGIILKSKTVTPTECLHYALSLPTSVVITGCDSMEILDQALKAVRTYRPMSGDEVQALLAKTKDAASHGVFELFKTSSLFDSTATNPQWLGDEAEHVKQMMPSE